MTRIALLTSGGDAPGMNTAVVAAAKVALGAGLEVLGVMDGYQGLMEGRLAPLRPADLDGWWHRGGTELGTARAPDFLTPAGRARGAANLAAAGVGGLLVIGGNGSLAGASALGAEHGLPVVGLPASIDNDLACTSASIGVDTALNTIVEACDRISDTARSHRRAFLVEVMGRQCGYLAMAAAIAAGADAVLAREQGKDEDQLVAELRALLRGAFAAERNKKRVLILKAEGVDVPTDRLAARLSAHLAEDAPGAGVRTVVLGHVVRGGNPSFRDRLIAGRLAAGAVWALQHGCAGTMAGWEWTGEGGQATPDSSVRLFPLGQVLHETEALISGSHLVTQRRLKLLAAVQGVLPL